MFVFPAHPPTNICVALSKHMDEWMNAQIHHQPSRGTHNVRREIDIHMQPPFHTRALHTCCKALNQLSAGFDVSFKEAVVNLRRPILCARWVRRCDV